MKVKLRAWVKETDKMVFQHDMNYGVENKEYYFSLNEEDAELLRYDEDYCVYVKCNAELMQYIGMKDEDGREIYEGDIVKRIDKTPIAQMYRKIIVGVVAFSNGSFVLNTDEGVYSMNNNKLSNMCSYKIIGNKHEDIELLKTIKI